ncbi:MAG: hypothetical protein J6D42_03835 [Clostridia bacterium]|nr:hypothetical protein [Clostridia bacterium]
MYNWDEIINKIYNGTIEEIENNEIQEEFVQKLSCLYEYTMSLRNNDDYTVNQPQMDKFIKVLNFFNDYAEICDGFLEPVKLIPKEEHCGITAHFLVFDVFGKEMSEFSKIISYLSALSVDATSDGGVCVSVTVPNVFVPKKKTGK